MGPENVMWWSPALFRIPARVLFGVAANDPFIPWAQGTVLRSKMLGYYPNAYVDLLQLAAGSTPFMHASVSSDSLQTFYDREQQLVAPLVAGG